MPGASSIEMIPIERIRFLNPRVRSAKKAAELRQSIESAGLKRPIVACKGRSSNGEALFDLVCGQGRVEAVKALGWDAIPSVIKDLSEEDRYLMSLAENIARRRRKGTERVSEIREMHKRGMTAKDIAKVTGLGFDYVNCYLRLFRWGETGLVKSVERNSIPLEIAMTIAKADEESVQKALQEAYESGRLSGSALIQARRLVEQRAAGNKDGTCHRRGTREIKSADDVVRAYRKEADRQKSLVRKNSICETRLTCIVGALRELLADDNYTNLLKAEGLNTLPKVLAEMVKSK